MFGLERHGNLCLEPADNPFPREASEYPTYQDSIPVRWLRDDTSRDWGIQCPPRKD